MSVHTKMHLTNKNMVEILFSTSQHFAVPLNNVIELTNLLENLKYVYKLKPLKSIDEWVSIEQLFEKDIASYTRPGLALKGARQKEGLTQAVLAKKLCIRQENLSKMENGKRPISKTMAHKLASLLKIDYRIFL